MSSQQRACPYCGTSLAADQRTCPNPSCGLPYPFDDEPQTLPDATEASTSTGRPKRTPGQDNPLGGLAPYRTILILVGVLILIVGVGYLLFRFGVSYLEAGRPEPSAVATATAGPVVVPSPASASPTTAGAAPSPGTQPGAIAPATAASPSPDAAGPRLKVANTEGQGANLRQRPSTTAPVLRTLPEGSVVEAIGGETNAEGRAWRNVRDQSGTSGYVAAELLTPE